MLSPSELRSSDSLLGDRAQSTPVLPCLWVSEDTLGINHLAQEFRFATIADNPEPGYHFIALKNEGSIRQLLRKFQAVSDADIRIFPAELLQFESPTGVLMKAQPAERWLAAMAGQPLSLADALDMAEDILADATIPSKRRNIELDELRRRCGVEDTFDWNRYIRDLEKEIHASVDAKKLNDRHERVRLELQSLLKETDPLKALDGKKFIAQRYGYKLSEIEQLLKYLDQSSKLPKPRCLSLDELFSTPQKGIDYVIPGMLPVGECALLVASPKAGKSLLAYDAAFAVATGEDAFLGETVKQGKVLIIQCDESMGSAHGRLLKRGFRSEDGPNVQFMDSFSILQLPELEERLEIFRPDLVIIDSLRRISIGTGISENSAEFADAIYKIKELLFRYNAAGILVHHTNKNQFALGVERVRGSSAIAGAVWGVWELSHIPKLVNNKMIIDPKDPTRILSVTARDIEGQRLKIELNPENNHWVSLGEDGVEEGEVTDRKSNEAKILKLLKSVAPTGLEASEINEHVGLDRGVYCYLNRLLGKGVIGSRPSSADRRRTVYFFPQSDSPQPEFDRKIDRNQGGGKEVPTQSTPPLPPPPVSRMRSTSETLDKSGTENRSQIRSQIRSQAKNAKTVTQSPAKNKATGTQPSDPVKDVPLSGQAQKSIPIGWWVRIPSRNDELAQVQLHYPTGACVDGQKGAYGVYPAITALSKNEMIALGLRWLD